jgi:Flp pilus assembly protein TadD
LNTTNAILKINPDDAKALGVRAAAYAGLVDEKKAKRDIERAIQLSPNDASLLNMQNIINNTF